MNSIVGLDFVLFSSSCWSSGWFVRLRLGFLRVSYLLVCSLYMRFRFNGCKRSRRAGMEAAISWTARRTTASSLGGLVSTEWLEAA
ncbi:unnamed protein product, partial [Brassica oleracea var. botrytis]